MDSLFNEFEKILKNPDYKYRPEDCIPFLNEQGFSTFIIKIKSLLWNYRSRDHLLFLRDFSKGFKKEYIDNLDYKDDINFSVFILLCLINYTIPKKDLDSIYLEILKTSENSNVRRFLKSVSILFLVPQILNQKYLRTRLLDFQGFVTYNLYQQIPLMAFYEKHLPLLKKLHSVVNMNSKDNSFYLVCHALRSREFSPEGFLFVQDLFKDPRFADGSSFVFNYFKLQSSRFNNLSLRDVTKAFPLESLEYLKKERPSILFMMDKVDEKQIGDLILTSVFNSNYKYFFKRTSEIKRSRDFFKDLFGVSSPKLVNFVKDSNVKSDNISMYIETLVFLGFFIKKFKISQGNLFKFLELAKMDESLNQVYLPQLLGSADVEELRLPFLEKMTELQKLAFLKNTIKESAAKELNLDDFSINCEDLYLNNQEHFDKVLKNTKFVEYNSLGKLNSLFNRENSRLKHIPFSFNYNSFNFPLEEIPSQVSGYELRLAKNTEDLLAWGFELRNCLGSYSITLPEEGMKNSEMILGLFKENKIEYAAEFSFRQLKAFEKKKQSLRNSLDKTTMFGEEYNILRKAYFTDLIETIPREPVLLSQLRGLYNQEPAKDIEESLSVVVSRCSRVIRSRLKKNWNKEIKELFKKYPKHKET